MEFPARKNKSKIYCCVFGCHSKACRDEKIKFFHFPNANKDFIDRTNKFGEKEKIDRRIAWIRVLRIGKSVTASMRVCSLHFLKSDFLPSPIGSTRSYLKKTSVPSQNLPPGSTSEYAHNVDTREERIRRRSFKKKTLITGGTEESSYDEKEDTGNKEEEADDNGKKEEENEDDGNKKNEDGKDLGPNEFNTSLIVAKENAACLKVFKDVGIQVESGLMIPKFCNLITSDQELSTLTGIPTFELLNLLEELVTTVRPTQKVSSKFDLRDMILMTFMKLKQNLSYAVLAILFKCSNDTCKDIIFDMIDILNLCLKPAIYWPTKDEILRNMPECFEGFENVRVVIDCTEIRLQRPSKLCCQLQTYSYYKSTYTVKFMTGVTPAGLISFVSKPYGGRVSDNMIFQQSELLKKMKKNDAILADRGFTVSNLCKEYDVDFISPLFLEDKTQFSKTEAFLNRNVAKARVHIERSNQRLKCFNILSNTMQMCLLSKVEEIFNIVCGLVNLSSPILKNDKFYS